MTVSNLSEGEQIALTSIDTATTLPIAPIAETVRANPYPVAAERAERIARIDRALNLFSRFVLDMATSEDDPELIQARHFLTDEEYGEEEALWCRMSRVFGLSMDGSEISTARANPDGTPKGETAADVFVPAGGPSAEATTTADAPTFEELTQGGKQLAEDLVQSVEHLVRKLHAKIRQKDDQPDDRAQAFMADGIVNLFLEEVPELSTHAVKGAQYPLDAVGTLAAHLGKMIFRKKNIPAGYRPEDRADFEIAFRIAQVYLRACRDVNSSKRQREEFSHLLLAATTATYRVAKGEKGGAQ